MTKPGLWNSGNWELPGNNNAAPITTAKQPRQRLVLLKRVTAFVLLPAVWFLFAHSFADPAPNHAEETLALCRSLNTKAGPPADFHERTQSDRFAPGTNPILVKNAKVSRSNARMQHAAHELRLLTDMDGLGQWYRDYRRRHSHRQWLDQGSWTLRGRLCGKLWIQIGRV